jgi:hypothetical protein
VESFQPWLSYVGIGVGVIVGGILLIWISVSLIIFAKTKGLPQAIGAFFAQIGNGDINGAYQSTSDRFKSKTSKQQFAKFIKTHKLNQYQRTTMSIPTTEGDVHCLEVTVISKTGREVPVQMRLVKQDKVWTVDDLSYQYVSKKNASPAAKK